MALTTNTIVTDLQDKPSTGTNIVTASITRASICPIGLVI